MIRVRRWIQDLQWILEGESLVSESVVPIQKSLTLRELSVQNLRCIEDWQSNDEEWQVFLKEFPRSYKLGIYAEALLGFSLRRFEGIEILASNLPVYRERQALGEFDFIVSLDEEPGRAIHWELAVKFYLCRERNLARLGQCTAADFVGPAGVDTLELKMGKMTRRQLKLASEPEGRAALSVHGISEIESRVLSRGRLFYYWRLPIPELKFSFTDLHHDRGFWCPIDEMGEWIKTQSSETRFYLASRIEWMAPFEILEKVSTFEEIQTEIEKHFKETDESACCVVLVPSKDAPRSENGFAQSAVYTEIARGFFTYEGFPNPIN